MLVWLNLDRIYCKICCPAGLLFHIPGIRVPVSFRIHCRRWNLPDSHADSLGISFFPPKGSLFEEDHQNGMILKGTNLRQNRQLNHMCKLESRQERQSCLYLAESVPV